MILLWLALGAASSQSPSDERLQAIERARQAVADEHAISDDELTVVSVTKLRWSDEGLDCEAGTRAPEAEAAGPGVPGFRILLAAQQQIFRVHVAAELARVCGPPLRAAGSLAPSTMESPVSPPNEPIPEDPLRRELVEAALDDLARYLEVDRGSLSFESFESVVWPDASLGCPREGMVYTQATREGFRILLRHGKRPYAYHGAGNGAPFLCEAPSTR